MNTAPLLQNIPNNRQNPPKKENWIMACARLRAGNSTLIYFLAIGIVFLGTMLFFHIRDNIDLNIPFFLGLTSGLVFLCAAVAYLLMKEANLGGREQLKYYELGNVQPLNAKQWQALRLHLVDMYYHGLWCRTLEVYPCEIRVSKKQFHPQRFDIEGKETYRKALNDDWGIVSKAQYEQLVGELFAGMHTKLFAADLDYVLHAANYSSPTMPTTERENLKKQNADFINRLAGLIGKPTAYVADCFENQGAKPKQLIWGFDLWRVLPMARQAFMAGYITEEEAWVAILKAADWIYYLFDSFEAFYDNFRLGNAYWSNDLETTSLRQQMWDLYVEKCDWAERDLPWDSSGTPDIPDDMKNGFDSYIREKNTKFGEPIGFKRNGDN